MNDWTKTSAVKPPENIMVIGILESGTEVKLVRRGNLYFPDGGNMYAYYTPMFWKLDK